MIDRRLLDAYVAELEAMRSLGGDFAKEHPEIAARLDIGTRRSQDPQVERVVESAAFLAARLRLMIDENATELPLAVLAVLAPVLAEPVPSMALIDLEGGHEPVRIARGSRFDFEHAGQALVCFATTMDTVAVPLGLTLRRLEPAGRARDGIAVKLRGTSPRRLLLCIGNNELAGAVLMDALNMGLDGVEIDVPGERAPRVMPGHTVRMHGFAREEAALPERAGTHPAHRLVTEFMAFPQKFRFVSVEGLPPVAGIELRLRFAQALPIPPDLAPDLITANRVPVVNLWRTQASPIDIDGRRIEHPVRVDALRYRTVECHSVEGVELHDERSGQVTRLDPVVGTGRVRGTDVQWGTRRVAGRTGGETLLYLRGLDYRRLGRERFLASPSVLASNRDVAGQLRTGTSLAPLQGLNGWRARLAARPNAYRPAIAGARAMETLVGFLACARGGLAERAHRATLQRYLRCFPGGADAAWIDGIERVRLRARAVVRAAQPHPGVQVLIEFAAGEHRTTSRAVLKRVLASLFEIQRGLNRVEDVRLADSRREAA